MSSTGGKRRRNEGSGQSASSKEEELVVPWVTMPGQERDIILDRLRKEVVPLLRSEDEASGAGSEGAVEAQGEGDGKKKLRKHKKAYKREGGLCQKKIRALLAFGVNEVARALEKDSVAFVLLCRDVRPVRLVDHLATSARMREVPFLVLPKASAMLGQVFGFKRMACLAIKKTTTGQQDEGEDTSTVQQEGAGMDQDAAATEAASIAVLESFCTLLVNKTDFINR